MTWVGSISRRCFTCAGRAASRGVPPSFYRSPLDVAGSSDNPTSNSQVRVAAEGNTPTSGKIGALCGVMFTALRLGGDTGRGISNTNTTSKRFPLDVLSEPQRDVIIELTKDRHHRLSAPAEARNLSA